MQYLVATEVDTPADTAQEVAPPQSSKASFSEQHGAVPFKQTVSFSQDMVREVAFPPQAASGESREVTKEKDCGDTSLHQKRETPGVTQVGSTIVRKEAPEQRRGSSPLPGDSTDKWPSADKP